VNGRCKGIRRIRNNFTRSAIFAAIEMHSHDAAFMKYSFSVKSFLSKAEIKFGTIWVNMGHYIYQYKNPI
jgi:hypothetical protein